MCVVDSGGRLVAYVSLHKTDGYTYCTYLYTLSERERERERRQKTVDIYTYER